MDQKTFIRIVQSFASKPCDVDYSSGILTAEIRGEMLEVSFSMRNGDLLCSENNCQSTPGQWIAKRLARLDSLAQCIIDNVPFDNRLIPIEATFTDTIEKNPEEHEERVSDALATIQTAIQEKHSGVTHVVYLTSDAGEGKTSLIEALARSQAERYKRRESDRLVLPISLGGQALIRLDDIIIGVLTNRLRFPYYYIESVIELARLDMIVLALDGFEEMFVETQTGGASSLGTLVSKLDAGGRVICSARTAFYRYANMGTQARMRASLKDVEVSFSEIHLERWGKQQFLAFCEKAALSLNEAQKLHAAIAAAIGCDHPLLTRAVLARKLIEEYVLVSDQQKFLKDIEHITGERYFAQFILTLLQREASVKWLTHEKPAQPLLTIDEHQTLLMRLAEEMWHNGVEALELETVRLTAEIVAKDEFRKPADIVRAVIEKTPQHAFLKQVSTSKLYRFDHEDFRSFYIGVLVGRTLAHGSSYMSSLRAILDKGSLPALAAHVASATVRELGLPAGWDTVLSDLAELGSRSSYLSENAGTLALALATSLEDGISLSFRSLLVSGRVALGRAIRKVEFVKCNFEDIDFSSTHISDVVLDQCTLSVLTLDGSKQYSCGLSLKNTDLPGKLVVRLRGEADARELYSPSAIRHWFEQLGVITEYPPDILVEPLFEEAEEILLTMKALRLFARTTGINESVLKAKIGGQWHTFNNEVLPLLIKHGVLKAVDYRGSGHQRRFIPRASFEKIENARAHCDGKFDSFLALLD